MILIYILIIPIIASLLTVLPLGKRWPEGVSIISSLLVFLLSIKTAISASDGSVITAINGWISCDGLSALLLLLIGFVSLVSSIFSWGYMEKHLSQRQWRKKRRYYYRLALFVFSMLCVPVFSQIALVWVAVELTTLFSVFLVSFENTTDALEAAWKYVVLTCMGAALALIGILILYWGMRAVSSEPFTWTGLIHSSDTIAPSLLKTAFLFILVGFGTKVGLVPLHTWLPDAHSQAPSPVCVLLSGIETTTVLYVILRLIPVLGSSPSINAGNWFIAAGLVSVAVAAFLLIQVRDYKRLFAFSTVEHMGIIMVAAGIGTASARMGATYQILAHSITKSLCFFAAGALFIIAETREIGSVRGLIRTSPLTGASLLIGGLAIAGAPPFAVFLSEFSILKAGIEAGRYIPISLLLIFIITAFCAVMFHINSMVFGRPSNSKVTVQLPPSIILSLVIAVVPVLLFGIYVPVKLEHLLINAASVLGR
ncbi:MAG: hypothetical protein GXO97_04280 [Nitrospirae bacterium]|nr:hypothetical protein [Nitrospirota bacterium]